MAGPGQEKGGGGSAGPARDNERSGAGAGRRQEVGDLFLQLFLQGLQTVECEHRVVQVGTALEISGTAIRKRSTAMIARNPAPT